MKEVTRRRIFDYIQDLKTEMLKKGYKVTEIYLNDIQLEILTKEVTDMMPINTVVGSIKSILGIEIVLREHNDTILEFLGEYLRYG